MWMDGCAESPRIFDAIRGAAKERQNTSWRLITACDAVANGSNRCDENFYYAQKWVSSKYHARAEHGREATASPIAFRLVSESYDSLLPPLPLHHPDQEGIGMMELTPLLPMGLQVSKAGGN
ncbi:hypothetical protein EVAR_80331_1 [Eumeta japonica]|uniref:Uncharacterized protein n=1 Tax=Eumeta variegata TaxID=151549 RepID=A0A4C1X0G6_EUMVA|nr:hypothetical protein EVAR_80331_1 [Eumeta japonica]